jgi:predicted molibdopterin-dependent oxidoreductase YjgC
MKSPTIGPWSGEIAVSVKCGECGVVCVCLLSSKAIREAGFSRKAAEDLVKAMEHEIELARGAECKCGANDG